MPVPQRSEIRIWPISLEQIEATVSDFLGPGRIRSNSPKPAFSRSVSMYLARHVGGWSYPKISRFYNGRHHTTALAAVRKIERLRTTDDSVDSLVEMLTATLSPETNPRQTDVCKSKWRRMITETIADRLSTADALAQKLLDGRASLPHATVHGGDKPDSGSRARTDTSIVRWTPLVRPLSFC